MRRAARPLAAPLAWEISPTLAAAAAAAVAVAVTAAIAASATTAATATATESAAAALALLCLVDADGATVDDGAVQARDGVRRLLGGAHGDETEAPGPAAVAVEGHVHVRDLTDLGERCPEGIC
jgi:hypothetical protein